MFLPLTCSALAVCLLSAVALLRGLKLDFPDIRRYVLAGAALLAVSVALGWAAWMTTL